MRIFAIVELIILAEEQSQNSNFQNTGFIVDKLFFRLNHT